MVGLSAHALTINLTKKNTVRLDGVVNAKSMRKLSMDLAEADAKRSIPAISPIYIVINSPGGSIFDGLDFLEFAKQYDNVHTICLFCASMAHHISQAMPGIRYGVSNTVMMAHRAKGGFRGQFGEGELESQLKLVKSVVKNMEQVNSNRLKISLKEYKEKIKDEWWTYGYENINQNVLDKIVNVKCSKALIDKKLTIVKKSFFGTYKYKTSACPLIK